MMVTSFGGRETVDGCCEKALPLGNQAGGFGVRDVRREVAAREKKVTGETGRGWSDGACGNGDKARVARKMMSKDELKSAVVKV